MKRLRILSTLVLVPAFYGCGGGGPNSNASSNSGSGTPAPAAASATGTAAFGLAIPNATVNLKDSKGASVAGTTDSSGNLSIVTTGLTPPFFLQVLPATCPGGATLPCPLYSVSADANASTVINIDPLTDMMMRSWYGTQGIALANAFANPVSSPLPNPAVVQVLDNVVTQMVQPWFTAAGVSSSNFSLVSTPFTAATTIGAGAGEDKVLDEVTLNLSNPASPVLTITNGAGTTQTTTVTFSTAGTLAVNTITATPTGVWSTSSGTVTVPSNSASTAASVTVLPQTASILAGSTTPMPFVGNVVGLGNTAVTWSLNGASCSGASCGSITSSGAYTPPATAPSPNNQVTVTALASDNVTKGTAAVSITAVPGAVVACPTANGGEVGVAFSSPALTSLIVGGAAPFTFSVIGTLPVGLTVNPSTGAITGTPTTSGSFAIRVTDANGFVAVGSNCPFTIVPGPSILCPAVAKGEVTVPYNQTVGVTGGVGPYNFTVVSTLPKGLSVAAGTGAITGTPTATGSFQIKVTDTNGQGAIGCTTTIAGGPSISTPAGGEVTVAYDQTPVGSGGSGSGYTYSIVGTLTAGLTPNASTGNVSGTPTASGSFQIKVTDSIGGTATSNTITVIAGPLITTPGGGEVGVAYNQTPIGSGGSGSGYTYSIVGTLPTGLTPNASGNVNGTPTASGSFQIKVTDGAGGTATSNLIMIIPGPGITTPSGGEVSVVYNQTAVGSGGSASGYSYSIVGTLPAGLTPNASGNVTGMPTAAGSFQIKVTDNAGGTATSNLITIIAGPSITTPNGGEVGVAYNQTAVGSGGSGSGYGYSIVGTLPAGLTPNASGNVNGTPTASGSFQIKVTDGAGGTVTSNLIMIIPGPSITTPSGGEVGVAYSQTASGSSGSGSGYSYSIVGMLPAGLTSNTSTGNVNGTPTASGSFQIKMTDSIGGNATSNTITIIAGPSITTPSGGEVGVAYNQTAVGSGGSGSGYIYSIVGTLPAGLTPNASGNVNGTPTASGSFQIKVTDGAGGTATSNTITIVPDPLIACPGKGNVGITYNQTASASGGAGSYTYSVVGGSSNLPAGLTLNTSTGNVSGTPTAPGLFQVMVTDGNGKAATSCVIDIGLTVSGNVVTINGGAGIPGVTITLSGGGLGGTLVTHTDGTGSFGFVGIQNGTYTITPALAAPPSVFYPNSGSNSVTVSGNNIFFGFQAALGFTVSGAVNYGGSKTGQVYLSLGPAGGCNNNGWTQGTSIPWPAGPSNAFTIRGVPPGTYTLCAQMDNLGFGSTNAANPTGSTTNLAVTTANVTGASVTLSNPTPVTLTSAPVITGISAVDSGAIVQYQGIQTNGVEQATAYTLRWSTDQTFASGVSSQTFPATGVDKGPFFWIVSGLTNGQTYYFQAEGVVNGAPSNLFSTAALPVLIGAPSYSNVVSGTVSFPGTAHGPLYVGFFDTSGNIFATAVGSALSPPTSPAPYTVQVPTISSGAPNYSLFGIIDQNNDGMVDVGDITNVRGNLTPIAITTTLAVMNLNLPSDSCVNSSMGCNGTVSVTTSHFRAFGAAGDFFSLAFNVNQRDKLPVGIEVVSNSLTSGAAMLTPMDIAACLLCGNSTFNFFPSTGGASPNVNDSYGLKVTYIDGSSETPNAVVNAVMASAGLATAGSPSGPVPGNTTPTFSWTAPATPPANYVYQFLLQDSSGNVIWNISGTSSNSAGFSPAAICTGVTAPNTCSLPWPTGSFPFSSYMDPTGANNPPSVPGLTSGQTYVWEVVVQDSNGNQGISVGSCTP